MSKQYAVIGLGKFGFSVATTLAQAGKEVLAVDKDAEDESCFEIRRRSCEQKQVSRYIHELEKRGYLVAQQS